MANDEFKAKIFEVIDSVLITISKNMMYKMIKPVINPAKMILSDALDKNPEAVVGYLKISRQKIDEAIAIYEKGKNANQSKN